MGLLKYPLFLFALLPLLNCSKESSKKEDPIPAQMEAQPKTTNSGGFSGTVAETMTSGGYTYVQLESGIWLAGPQSDIAKGEPVHTDDAGSEMQDFVSKSLNRTFKSIYFVQAIHKGSHGTHEGTENPHAGMGSNAAESSQPEKTVIENLSVPTGGHSIQDIFAKKSDLVGKTVSLRAKVVKANFGIMNTNWYHLQDGTGLEGTNDLTITSLSKAQVGNTVLVKGTLTADKDFGQGYKYALIIEGASLTVE
jgi:hypothetical protein